MTVDSLEQLEAAFGRWRTEKKHVREKMPEELLTRARRAATTYGCSRVAQAAKVDRRRLETAPAPAPAEGHGMRPMAPTYSRVELVAPPSSARPFAELETPGGIKVRLYSQTRETLDLLSAVCVSGGGR